MTVPYRHTGFRCCFSWTGAGPAQSSYHIVRVCVCLVIEQQRPSRKISRLAQRIAFSRPPMCLTECGRSPHTHTHTLTACAGCLQCFTSFIAHRHRHSFRRHRFVQYLHSIIWFSLRWLYILNIYSMPTGCGLPVSSSSLAMMMMMTVMVVVLHRHRYPYSHIVITWQSIDHVPGRDTVAADVKHRPAHPRQDLSRLGVEWN